MSVASKYFALTLATALCMSSNGVQAQLSRAEIEASIDSRVGELEWADQLLSHPEPNRRVAAMEVLLKSGDVTLARRAREFGLFSDDHLLRQLAVKAIFEAGGAFRIETDAPHDGSTNMTEVMRAFGGAVDGEGRGSIQFVLSGEFDSKEMCWLRGASRVRLCVLRPTGDSIHLAEWSNTTGQFKLDDEGVLRGFILFRNTGLPVAARIPLLD